MNHNDQNLQKHILDVHAIVASTFMLQDGTTNTETIKEHISERLMAAINILEDMYFALLNELGDEVFLVVQYKPSERGCMISRICKSKEAAEKIVKELNKHPNDDTDGWTATVMDMRISNE